MVDKKTKPNDLARPGHIFPLRCDAKGLTKRAGHTEASIELCKLANLYPAAAICEIIGENGKMAGMEELKRIARKHNLKIIRIRELIGYLKE